MTESTERDPLDEAVALPSGEDFDPNECAAAPQAKPQVRCPNKTAIGEMSCSVCKGEVLECPDYYNPRAALSPAPPQAPDWIAATPADTVAAEYGVPQAQPAPAGCDEISKHWQHWDGDKWVGPLRMPE